MLFKKNPFNNFLASINITDDMDLPYKKYFLKFVKNDEELKDLYSYYTWLRIEFILYKKYKFSDEFETFLEKMELSESLSRQLKDMNVHLSNKIKH